MVIKTKDFSYEKILSDFLYDGIIKPFYGDFLTSFMSFEKITNQNICKISLGLLTRPLVAKQFIELGYKKFIINIDEYSRYSDWKYLFLYFKSLNIDCYYINALNKTIKIAGITLDGELVSS